MQLLNDLRNYRRLDYRHRIYLLSFLIALSGVLSVLDMMIPKPLPMAKIGLANIVTLIMIMEGQFYPALIVAFFRTFVASLMIGSFLSYTYLLSLSGATGSVLFTWIFYRLFQSDFTETGLSVIGAFSSTVCQGLIVIAFFGADKGTLLLVSTFSLISIGFGFATGLIAKSIRRSAFRP